MILIKSLTLQAPGISYSQIRMTTILVKAFQIVIEIISDMFWQKVNLSELYRDAVRSAAKFPQNFGPETRMLLETYIGPFWGQALQNPPRA